MVHNNHLGKSKKYNLHTALKKSHMVSLLNFYILAWYG